MQAGQDYTALRDALQSGHFQAADDETRALLIRLAGPEAEKRDWVYFTEVSHDYDDLVSDVDIRFPDNTPVLSAFLCAAAAQCHPC